MEDKFAVLIPTTKQIGFDTFKDSYITLVISNKLTFEQILIEVKKISKAINVEDLHFTTITQPEVTTNNG